MGVSGVGKTTLGESLARELAVPYADGDDFHSAAAKAKMASGHPLDDADRWPWLDRIGAYLASHRATGAVTSCSSLKRVYRARLEQAAPSLVFVHLTGDPEVIAARIEARKHHYMPASLLKSQLAALEPLTPEERGVVLDATKLDPSELVDAVLRFVGEAP